MADADEEVARTALTALEERVRLPSLRGEIAKTVPGAEPQCAVQPARSPLPGLGAIDRAELRGRAAGRAGASVFSVVSNDS